MLSKAYLAKFNEFVASLEASHKPVVELKSSFTVYLDDEEVEITKAPGEWIGGDDQWNEPVCLPDFSAFPLLEAEWFGTFSVGVDWKEPSCDSCLGQ